MSADELGGRVYHNVGSVLDRTYNIRCAEGIVYNEWYVVAMCHLSHSLKIGYVRVRIAECLCIHHLGVGLYGSLQSLKVVYIDDGIGYTLCCESVGYEVERASIEVVGSYYVVAILQDVLQGIGHGGSSRSYGKTSHTTLKGSHTVFEDTLCRVGKTSVDVACVAQTEAVGSVL